MNVQNLLLYALVFIIPVISGIYIAVGIKLFKHKGENRINYFSLFMFAAAIYSFGYFLELNCESLDMLLLVRNFEYLGAVFIPTFAFLFIAELTKVEISPKVIGVLILISILLWLIFITNPVYNLIYKSIGLQVIDGFSVVFAVRGPAFYSMMLYDALFLIFSSSMVLKAYQKPIKPSRKRSFLFLLITLQLPWFAVLFILLGFDTYMDPVPATIMIISILIGINEFKNDIFELEINKWNNLFLNIGEPAFLVNKRNEVVCSNRNANKFFRTLNKTIIDIIKNLDDAEVNRQPVFLKINDEERWLEVEKNNFDIKKRYVNYLLIDVTEQKKEQEQIRYLNYHDHLTGLYNRRFYEEELKRLDTKINLPLTLVMGDVNGLKMMNDSFGHFMGDELLKKTAECIKTGCRDNEIIARLGGDEFIILLPKTNAFEAEQIIKRIKKKISLQKVGAFDISISFGYQTKEYEEENIHDIFKKAEDYMYRCKLYESSNTKSKNIDLIVKLLYEKSQQERLHSKRVSKICESIAIKMKFEKQAVNQIKIAGLIHDIGKIGIEEKILNKSEKLNPEECKEMRKHSEIGYRILNASDEFSEMAKYILEHHERWDGKGYPKGIKDVDISLQARIIAVANTYDAITNDRTDQKGLSEEEAINEIKRGSGTKFDPEIVKLFNKECIV